ncbi:MAG: response regulator [Aureispira sp.]|nr:response regulator [Aureispira sp.]
MKKILIIEDNPEVRENTAEILELSGYNVETAENGRIGAHKAVEFLPDLIICDIMMPELDGYGVLKILSKNTQTNTIPFIFLTAKADKTDFRKGMNMGADDYITKPFDDVELLNAIETRLKKHSMLATNNNGNQPAEVGNVFEQKEHQEKALEHLLEGKEERIYRKKDVIFKEGAYPRYVFFVKKGKLKTFKTNEFGKELILSLYGEGDFIGIMDTLKESQYSETAIALSETELYLIPVQEFTSLLTADTMVSKQFMERLAQELGEKENQLLDLAYNSVRKRVAEALVKLKKRYQKDENERFEIAILREDLASMVGTAKETVIRTLSEFKHEHLIDIKGSKIILLEPQKLEEMPN